jgi:hypothetical protein
MNELIKIYFSGKSDYIPGFSPTSSCTQLTNIVRHFIQSILLVQNNIFKENNN